MKCANAHIIPDDRQIKIPWGAPLNTSYAHQSDSGQGSADPYHDQDLDLIQSLLGADIVPSNDEEKWFDISEHQNPETPDVLSFFGGRKQGPLSAVYDINVHDVARAREDTEESTKDSLAMGIAAEATHDRLEKLAGLNDTGDLGYSALARRFSGRYQTPVSPSSDDIEAQAGSVPWASNRSSMVMGTHEALSKALCAVQEDLDSPSQAPTPPSHQISPSSLLKRHHSLPHQQARSIESLAGAGDVIDGNDAAHAIEEHERFHEVQTELENVMETTHGQLGRKSTWEGELGEHQPHDMQPDTGGQPNSGYALQYYQMHLMWLEEQNKKRIARQKQITMPKDGSDRQPAVLLPSKQQSGGSQAPWPEADETLRLAVSFYDQFTTSENTETTSTSQSTALATSEQENAHNQNGTEGLDYNNPGSKPSLSQVRQRRSSNSSDISQTSSLASIGDSLFSLASASSMSSILSTHGAGDRLITLLREDPVLQPLYRDALIRVAVERLERNLRRLLKRFAVDLRKEAEGPQQRGAAHFVRSRARNSAHIICSSLKCDAPKPIPKSFPTMNISSEAVEDVSDNSSDSDNQEDELADLRELEAFIVTSMAFETLRLNLRLFVYPEESAVSVPELSVGTGTTDCPSLGPPMMAEELGGTSESYSAESESGCFRTTLALYKYFVILWLFLYLFIYFVILWLLVYLPWQHRVFHYDLDLEPGTLVHYARSSRFARWDSNPDICSINGVYIGYCVGWAFAVILGIISAMPLWILKRFISLKSRTTKISRGIIDITNDQSKNSSDDLSHKDNACTKSLKPSRWRFTTERKYLEERIFTTLPTVSRLWQNFGEYGKRHSLPVMLYELMRWEPRIPKGKTRIRWKCVSGFLLHLMSR
jgi:hypothetical protein